MSLLNLLGGSNAVQSRNFDTRQLTTFNLERRSKTIHIPRGKRVVIGEAEGRGFIANLWMTFPGWFWQHWNTSAPVSQTILKTLILRIYWDGAAKPAVEAPVGDFFGIGLCEVASFASKYFGMSSGGFFCKFPMPFQKKFRVEVENMDEHVDTDVFMNVLYQLDETLPPYCGYFHSQFNTAKLKGPEPVRIAERDGRGFFAGCTLSMQGENQNYLSFLEAPEYIYVDDDWETPRIVGTGLEDYFLGGWYFREGTFHGPLHGVPVKDTLNASVAMYRAHELDAIHFEKRFRMDFVNPWDPDRLQPFAYSSAAFLYSQSPEGSGKPLPSRDDLLCWYRIRNCDHQSVP
jgi:D-arabinan exo alpha-(1,3)/(1,5)-arabinofuranosidase (non-reducing end)